MESCICTVGFLEELLICTEPNCIQPHIRCKKCFKYTHRYDDDTHQKKTHSSEVFTNSPLFKNFTYLIKILEIIKKKVAKDFDGLSLNIDQLADVIFSSSEIIKNDVFNNN